MRHLLRGTLGRQKIEKNKIKKTASNSDLARRYFCPTREKKKENKQEKRTSPLTRSVRRWFVSWHSRLRHGFASGCVALLCLCLCLCLCILILMVADLIDSPEARWLGGSRRHFPLSFAKPRRLRQVLCSSPEAGTRAPEEGTTCVSLA